jgi:hypothetical protein
MILDQKLKELLISYERRIIALEEALDALEKKVAATPKKKVDKS